MSLIILLNMIFLNDLFLRIPYQDKGKKFYGQENALKNKIYIKWLMCLRLGINLI